MTAGSSNYVLVVDDDADLRESLEILLQLHGYAVSTASNASQALLWLRSGRPHPCMILLDVMMPGMNGIELREHLNADATLAEIPVVFITGALAVVAESAKGLKTRVLGKPFDLENLLTLVGDFCRSEQVDE